MRKTFSKVVEEIGKKDKDVIFLTGDLGFNALENVRESLGERFINMGVAEQNMLSVAAGMAYKGYKVFCYSIAPFIVYRALEQMRNDICFHDLPVYLVGNGGGYGYGIMGSTHHAINDLGTLGGLPNIKCWIPAFREDLKPLITKLVENKKPAYLRLGLGIDQPNTQHTYSDFNLVYESQNAKITIIALGPLVENVLKALKKVDNTNKCDLYTAVTFPFEKLPDKLLESINKSKNLMVIEEHVKEGGISQHISSIILEQNIKLNSFTSKCAAGYPNEKYGSQKYHQEVSGLDEDSILNTIKQMLKT